MIRCNKEGLEHGYYEWKSLGKVWIKYALNNGMYLGYLERYHENGKIEYKQINI